MRRTALALAAVLLIAAGDPKTESEHVVTAGETLTSIARRAGVPVTAVAEANGMMETARLRAGQKLVIPRQQSHTVRRGETRFGIAYQYGVSWEQIATANRLAEDAAPRPGQKLIIPALIPQRVAAAPALPPLAPRFLRPHDGPVLLGWQRRADGTGHEGIDFAAETGDRVRAAAAGKVLFAGDEPSRFGKLVVLDHGGGWHTAYGNLSRITVKKGDSVRAGERIGLAGQSGDAKQPELHFEIRQGDKPVDPAPLLKD
jgi:murein DD-endopeptidase MepM/ murein hydrolase activator NlpD